MGSFSPAAKTDCSDTYLTLGLNRLDIKLAEAPPVISVLSSLLDRTVQRDEKVLISMDKKEPITVFHGLRAPSLNVEGYIERIFKYANCSPSCFVLAHIYIDRYLEKSEAYLTSLNVHRLLITSIVVAAKFIDDAFFNNAYYARVGGISKYEMNKLEMNFLLGLDFRFHVTVETFSHYCLQLEKEAMAGACQIERQMRHQCGLKGWASKEEVEGQQALQQRYRCGAV